MENFITETLDFKNYKVTFTVSTIHNLNKENVFAVDLRSNAKDIVVEKIS